MGRWTLDTSPVYVAFDLMTRMLSQEPIRGVATHRATLLNGSPAL